MPDDPMEVIDAAPPAAVEPPETEPVLPHDRPVQNVMGEWNRKFGSLNQKLDNVLAFIASQNQPRPTEAPRAKGGDLSDDELWSLAQQGDKAAFVEHQRRISRQEVTQARAIEARATIINNQLGAIYSRYPELNDPSNPLTQRANMAFELLVQNGYPRDRATQLEAAKTAITDSPDLVTESYSKSGNTREGTRRTATQTAQSGVTGVTHRADPERQGQTRVSTEEMKLAQRMGVKDPAKAKERFLQRQKDGRSSFGNVGIGGITDNDF